ncbi:MAG: AtpZ/AtpI family protein [Saprospiraceae bacterium]|nr:AtpZ/AtpI family protein [Saprospiraceae bacterium]
MVKKSGEVNAYLKYAGLAFQIFGILAVGAFLGQWIDEKLNFSQPWMTILLIVFLFAGIIYKIFLETSIKKK